MHSENPNDISPKYQYETKSESDLTLIFLDLNRDSNLGVEVHRLSGYYQVVEYIHNNQHHFSYLKRQHQ